MTDTYINIEFYDNQDVAQHYDVISLDVKGKSNVKFELMIDGKYEEWVAVLPVSYHGKIKVLEKEGIVVINSTSDFCVFNYIKKRIICYFNKDFFMVDSIFCEHRREITAAGYTEIIVYNIDSGKIIWQGEFSSTKDRIIDGLKLDSINNNILDASIFLPGDGGYYPFQLNLDSRDLIFEKEWCSDIFIELGKI